VSSRRTIREYANGSLWVYPSVGGLLALLIGFGVSQIDVGPDSFLEPLAFQGTADDARAVLSIVAATVVTVIALVLGLTVVALQLSSTQFSPRLIRNFLRDRPNQVVLGVFVATFAYSAAGLYTVGEAAGARTEQFPRIAVSGSILLLFASLAMVIYFADHLAHSIQVDTIGRNVERQTLAVAHSLPGRVETAAPIPPVWASPLLAAESGYVQAVYPEQLLAIASRHRVQVRLRLRVGEHVVAGTLLAWLWTPDPDDPVPDLSLFRFPLDAAVKIGFERTLEQDAAFGIRQLVDMACKALSPAVNDPYTAVQAIDHLSVIFSALAVRPLGDDVVADGAGTPVVIAPGRRFGDYLDTMCGLIRRYGASEPTVSLALIRLLETCAAVLPDDAERWAALGAQADLILADARREIAQPADVDPVAAAADELQEVVRMHLPER